MPIYEYRCSACGKELEALQKLSDKPLTTCPACHGETLVKRVSAAGFQLKGSGWYVTDFKGSGKPAAKKEGAESSSDAKSGDKSETKTEAASESKSGSGDSKSESKSEAKSESKGEAKTESKGSKAASSGNGTPPAAN